MTRTFFRNSENKTILASLGLTTVLMMLWIFAAAPSASAQASIEIFHQALTVKDLPLPGANLAIRALLGSTKDTERRMRALVVRDGRVSDLVPVKTYLDEYDQATYEFNIPSPLAEISYQFVLYNPDNSIVSSQRYSVRRPCIPYIDISTTQLEPKTQGEARLDTLVKLSRGLEREVSSYETGLKLAEDLKARLDK